VLTTATEIVNRINEISFNSTLMRAISFVTRLIQDGRVGRDDMKEMLIHSVRSDETMTALSVSIGILSIKSQDRASVWRQLAVDTAPFSRRGWVPRNIAKCCQA
jgi:hypothetical protein